MPYSRVGIIVYKAHKWKNRAIMSLISLMYTYVTIIAIITSNMIFSLFCPTSLRGFCSSFTVIDLKASISPSCPQTEVISMCTGHLRMIRYMNMSYSEHWYVYYSYNTIKHIISLLYIMHIIFHMLAIIRFISIMLIMLIMSIASSTWERLIAWGIYAMVACLFAL